MSCYPICLNIEGRKCVVIGGGKVAERKVNSLLQSGAKVLLVSPDLTSGLRKLAEDNVIDHISSAYEARFVDQAFLVIAATNDRVVNRCISEDAQNRGVLINVVDDPCLCTFYAPAVVRRGDMTISVSTAGKSPSLSRRIKENLEIQFGDSYGEFVELMGEIRTEVFKQNLDSSERADIFDKILDSDLLEILATYGYDKAREKALQYIQLKQSN